MLLALFEVDTRTVESRQVINELFDEGEVASVPSSTSVANLAFNYSELNARTFCGAILLLVKPYPSQRKQ